MSAIQCKLCGRFCGQGSEQYRSHDWQGVPVEDYLICAACNTADDGLAGPANGGDARTANTKPAPDFRYRPVTTSVRRRG